MIEIVEVIKRYSLRGTVVLYYRTELNFKNQLF